MESGQHLLVQAGTGTGKSLGLPRAQPAARRPGRRRDGDARAAAPAGRARHPGAARRGVGGARASSRRTPCSRAAATTRACTAIRDGVPDDQGALIDIPRAPWAPRCSGCAQWAEEQESEAGGPGDRDSAPSHTDRVWRQVSVSHRECLGATKCPYASECFAERARERAMSSSLIVTNHSLLAIDAIEGVPMIPDYDVVVVDEAHELAPG